MGVKARLAKVEKRYAELTNGPAASSAASAAVAPSAQQVAASVAALDDLRVRLPFPLH
jgi:hypothetical protein